jgi:thiamine transport system substrate-binding protein
MFKFPFAHLLLGAVLTFFITMPVLAQTPDLVVYTYDSFNSEWGPGPVVFKSFEEHCACTVKVIAPGDSGTVLSRTILEKANPKADVLLGVNDSEVHRSFQYNIWEPYRSPNLKHVVPELQLDPQHRVTPFDHGYIAFVYDSEALPHPPQSLEALTDPSLRGKIVIESPKTSSPGLSFLHWTIAVYGEDGYLAYWNRLKPNLLTITDGWSAAYGMFTKSEVPIVLSYITSPAYHLEYEKTERYKTVLFKEGMYRQIEFAGILKGAKHLERARQFIDFMLTAEFQDTIPLTNWMFPAAPHSPLPASFRIVPKPEQHLTLDRRRIAAKNSAWLRAWSRTMSN